MMMKFNQFFPTKFNWVLMILVILGLAVLLRLTLKLVLNRMKRWVNHTHSLLDESVVEAARKPINYFINFGAFIWICQTITQYHQIDWSGFLLEVWNLGVILLFGAFLLSLIKAFELNMIKRTKPKYDSTTIMAVGRLLRLSIVIIIILMIMQNFGFSISGVLAFGGVGGIAIGFAAKDLLANFFGGFMIFIDKPFRVGDWISSPDRQIEGTVENIGWRMTRIRTFDLRPLYVPNSTFMNIAVENPSRMLHRRIYENIGLRYDDINVIDKIVAEIKEMLYNHPDIDNQQTIIVAFDQFAASSLNIMVYTFTKTTAWVEFYVVKQKILLLIRDIVDRHGAEFAFPTQQLFVTQNPAGQDPAPQNLATMQKN
ncbi:hypothetical protein A6A19_03385 [Actinobacillus delphinicola]|nr:hypothetical protein [Actinobacillus delphinicola]